MNAPTQRQLEVLRFIANSPGGAPSLREVGRAFGIGSTNGVNDHFRALIKKGLLEKEPLKSRAVRVTAAGLRALRIAPCSHCGGTGRAS